MTNKQSFQKVEYTELKFDLAIYISGIKRNKTVADKLMYIPNDDTQNYYFYRSELVVEPFKHST